MRYLFVLIALFGFSGNALAWSITTSPVSTGQILNLVTVQVTGTESELCPDDISPLTYQSFDVSLDDAEFSSPEYQHYSSEYPFASVVAKSITFVAPSLPDVRNGRSTVFISVNCVDSDGVFHNRENMFVGDGSTPLFYLTYKENMASFTASSSVALVTDNLELYGFYALIILASVLALMVGYLVFKFGWRKTQVVLSDNVEEAEYYSGSRGQRVRLQDEYQASYYKKHGRYDESKWDHSLDDYDGP